MAEQKKVRAGWYIHPDLANTLCFWDGSKWTDDVAPYMPSPKAVGFLTIAQGVALGTLVAALASALIFNVVTADDGLDCATENVDRALAGLPALDC